MKKHKAWSKVFIVSLAAFVTLCFITRAMILSCVLMVIPLLVVFFLSKTVYSPSTKSSIVICQSVIVFIVAISVILISFGFFGNQTARSELIVLGVYLLLVCTILLFDSQKRIAVNFYQDVSSVLKDKNQDNHHKESKREAPPPSKKEIPTTPVTVMAEGMLEKIKAIGLSKYLLTDFRYTTNISNQDIMNKETTRGQIALLLKEVLIYLKLPPFITLELIFLEAKDSIVQTQCGRFISNGPNKRIVINICEGFNIHNVIAILCHECTHYFMEVHSLNWDDTSLNELRTDVMANLIGFNSVMILGYKESSITKQEGSIQRTIRHKVGYITSKDCIDLKLLLTEYRIKLHEQEEYEKLLTRKKRLLAQHITAAISVLEQLNNLDIKTNRIVSPLQIDAVQKVLSEYEGRNIQKEIDSCKLMLNSTQVEQVEQADIRIDTICTDMLQWLKTLQPEKKTSPDSYMFVFCRKCGKRLPSTALFCSNCGAKLILYCRMCGKKLMANSNYCSRCGTRVVKHSNPH